RGELRGDPRQRAERAERAAPGARRAAERRAGHHAPAGPRRPGRAARIRARRGRGGHRDDRRHPPAAPPGGGPVRLPDRAGSAEQRDAARARSAGPGEAALRRCRPGGGGPQRVPARDGRRGAGRGAGGGGRAWHHRHARTRRHAWWPPPGRPDRERRVPGDRRPSAGQPARGEPAVTIRVVIADDQGMVRSGFSVLLNAQPDIEVIAEAVNGQEAVAHAAGLRPDVILMDVRMPVLDGLQATRQITALPDHPKVLVLTTFDLDDYVYEALRSGASGFLLKDASAGELAEAVRLVAAGDALLAPGVTRRLIAEFARMGAPRSPGRKQLEGLTERE